MHETAERFARLAKAAGYQNIGLSPENQLLLVRYFCTNNTVGIWVDTFDQNFLYETLVLADSDFNLHFSELDLTLKERVWLKERISGHVPICQRCTQKVVLENETKGVAQAT